MPFEKSKAEHAGKTLDKDSPVSTTYPTNVNEDVSLPFSPAATSGVAIDQHILSEGSARNILSVSPQNSLQITASRPSLKCCSHSPLNPNITDDEPVKKRVKIMFQEIAGPSKNMFYSQDTNPSLRAIDKTNPVGNSNKITLDAVDKSSKFGNLWEINLKPAVKKQWWKDLSYSKKSLASHSRNSESVLDSSNACDKKNPSVNYFEHVPFDVIEIILGKLPFSDLMKSRFVCKMWTEVIDNSTFLEWKKTYHDVKFQHNKSQLWSTTLTYLKSENVCAKNCLTVLISFMDKKFEKNPPLGLAAFLCKIPSCVIAERLLLERFSETPLLCENAWCILTVTVILSLTVEDLYNVFNHLINVCHCDYTTMLEAMFCIATIFLYFVRTCSLNHGLHYRLYYVIYLLENELPFYPVLSSVESEETKIYGRRNLWERHHQPPVPKVPLTYEQIGILNHRLGPNQIVKICGFAGTGKTTTLLHLAKKHSNLKFLYISSRKVSCRYAASLFPSNVVCKTANLLAYEAVGELYQHKLKNKLLPADIEPFVHRWSSFSCCMHNYFDSIFKTIDTFINSTDESITKSHVHPEALGLMPHLCLGNQAGLKPFNLYESSLMIIMNEAQELWEKMVSKDNTECKITPEIYLKLYQLSRPSFRKYDCIMIDEAEDFSTIMLNTMLSQGLPVILAYDHRQKIGKAFYKSYPIDSDDDPIACTHTYSLTKSLRFGPEIAYVANCCYEVIKSKTDSILIGSLKESYVDGIIKGQYAVIARSKRTLFLEAIRLCCTSKRHPHEPTNFQGAFAGEISDFGFDKMIKILKKLKDKKKLNPVENAFISTFESFVNLNKYADYKDKSIVEKNSILEEYGAEIEGYVNIIKQKCSFDLAMADVVFSTVQNAKGLEFDTVQLAEDFRIRNTPNEASIFRVLLDNSKGFFKLDDSHNNIYVALTRAKRCLILSETVQLLLLRAQEEFKCLVPSSSVFNNAESLKCALCSRIFVPTTLLTMVRRSITIASGRQMQGGSLCTNCSTNPDYIYAANYRALIVPRRSRNHYCETMAGFVEQTSN